MLKSQFHYLQCQAIATAILLELQQKKVLKEDNRFIEGISKTGVPYKYDKKLRKMVEVGNEATKSELLAPQVMNLMDTEVVVPFVGADVGMKVEPIKIFDLMKKTAEKHSFLGSLTSEFVGGIGARSDAIEALFSQTSSPTAIFNPVDMLMNSFRQDISVLKNYPLETVMATVGGLLNVVGTETMILGGLINKPVMFAVDLASDQILKHTGNLKLKGVLNNIKKINLKASSFLSSRCYGLLMLLAGNVLSFFGKDALIVSAYDKLSGIGMSKLMIYSLMKKFSNIDSIEDILAEDFDTNFNIKPEQVADILNDKFKDDPVTKEDVQKTIDRTIQKYHEKLSEVESLKKEIHRLNPDEESVDSYIKTYNNVSNYNFLQRKKIIELSSKVEELNEIFNPIKDMEDISSNKISEITKEWKKGVVWSEIKYGENLDHVTKDGNKKSYQSLIASLQKKEKIVEDQLADEKDIQGFMSIVAMIPSIFLSKSLNVNKSFERESLDSIAQLKKMTKADFLTTIVPSRAMQSFAMNKEIMDVNIANFENQKQAIIQNTPVKIQKPDGTIFQLPPLDPKAVDLAIGNLDKAIDLMEKAKQTDGVIALSPTMNPVVAADNFRVSSNRAIAWHETGHQIEFLTNAVQESVDFIEKKNFEVHQTQTGYTTDTLMDWYSGTVYKNPQTGMDISTELVSTAMEYLSDPNALKLAARYDREHILYGMYVLNKERKS